MVIVRFNYSVGTYFDIGVSIWYHS